MLTSAEMNQLQETFDLEGYVVLPGLVSASKLSQLHRDIESAFERAKRSGELEKIGGVYSGHLNCFPGEGARFAYETLRDEGVVEFVRRLSPKATRMPTVGCNANLPSSHAQNLHIDGYSDEPFIVANVAVVDTTTLNGALEVVPRSHDRAYKYWEIRLARDKRPKRLELKAGDVAIRTSELWHRGTRNFSASLRPMLGFTWADGGSPMEDPFLDHAGRITFLANRYTTNLAGKLRERAFATAPALGSGYLFVRSLLRR